MLDDNDPDERKHGINAGLAWGDVADAVIIYTDRGISNGMRYGIANHEAAGRRIEYRRLGYGNTKIKTPSQKLI